jgi:hypothetical protein
MFRDRSRLAVLARGRKLCHVSNVVLTIRTVPAIDPRVVVSSNRVSVHHFASVVCIIACVLEPHRKVMIVEAFFDKPGVSA